MKTNIATSFLISLVLHITILYSFFSLYPVKIRVSGTTVNVHIVSTPGTIKKTLSPVKQKELRPNKYYTINKGDTLWDLSKKFLNDPYRWPEFVKDNPQIKDPNMLYAGATIRMPKSVLNKTETPIVMTAEAGEEQYGHDSMSHAVVELKKIIKTKDVKKTVVSAKKKEPDHSPEKLVAMTKPKTKKTTKKKTVTANSKMEISLSGPITTMLTDDRKLVKQPKTTTLKKPQKKLTIVDEQTVTEKDTVKKVVVNIAEDGTSKKEKDAVKEVFVKEETTPDETDKKEEVIIGAVAKPEKQIVTPKTTAKKKPVAVDLSNNDELYKEEGGLKELLPTKILTDIAELVEPPKKPLQEKAVIEIEEEEAVEEETAADKPDDELQKDKPELSEPPTTTLTEIAKLIEPLKEPLQEEEAVEEVTATGKLNKNEIDQKAKTDMKETPVVDTSVEEVTAPEKQIIAAEPTTKKETTTNKIDANETGEKEKAETEEEPDTTVLKAKRVYKLSKKTGITKHPKKGRESTTEPAVSIKDQASLIATEGGGKPEVADKTTAIAPISIKAETDANTSPIGPPEPIKKLAAVAVKKNADETNSGESSKDNKTSQEEEEPLVKDKGAPEVLTSQDDISPPLKPELPSVSTTGSHKKTKRNGDTTEKPKETAAAAVVEEKTRGFLLTNDIIISVFLNEFNIADIDFKLSSEPHPSNRKRRRITTHASKRDISMKEFGSKKDKKVFTVHKADNGVYYFMMTNNGATAQTTSLTFLLYGGKNGERTKEIKDITINATDSVTFKFVMPETVFWSDDKIFTGTIEGPDSITKYNEELGIVWTEKKR